MREKLMLILAVAVALVAVAANLAMVVGFWVARP
jgi:hypothetical protein